MTPRKKKLDSVAGEVQTMQDATAGPLKPPSHIHLRERDYPFWDAIIAARPRSKWDDMDLAMAANLARCLSDIEYHQEDLDRQGPVLENARGTLVANPLHSVLEALSRRAVAFSRMLHVHPEAKDGASRTQKKASQKVVEAMEVVEGSDEGLIPRPRAPH